MAQSDETTIRLKSADSLKLYIDDRGPIELSGKTLGNCIDSFITQSDAPNEGREEAEQYAKSEWKKDHTQDVRPLAKGYLAGYNNLRDQLSIARAEIDGKDIIIGRLNDQLSKEREFNDKLKQGLENGSERWKKHLELENKVLKDQLEKERETTEQIKKSFGQIVHDLKMDLQKEREINENLHKAMTTAEQRGVEKGLEEGREMRKELVVGLRKITSTIPNVNNSIELMMWNIANDLISKASELDKNKET